MTTTTCLLCERTEEQAPLLVLTYKGEEKFICAQCLPTLIHKPHLLADQLPGMEVVPSANHY